MRLRRGAGKLRRVPQSPCTLSALEPNIRVWDACEFIKPRGLVTYVTAVLRSGDPQHFVQRRDAGAHRAESVVAQRPHALGDRHRAQLLRPASALNLETEIV